MTIQLTRGLSESSDRLLNKFNKLSLRFVRGLRKSNCFLPKLSALKKKHQAIIRAKYVKLRNQKRFYE